MLFARNLVSSDQLHHAIERQRVVGGRLEENLVALGFISREKLLEATREPPTVPTTIEETDLEPRYLVHLVLKCMYANGIETIPELSKHVKLASGIIEHLLDIAKREHMVEIRGTADHDDLILRYALTGLGRDRVAEAMEKSRYAGAAPVSLRDFRYQVERQSVSHEHVSSRGLAETLSHLVLPDQVVRQLGPALNSGKPTLLYGPSGNGKTSIANAIGQAFEQGIYLPYAIEIDDHVIRIFDPGVHEQLPPEPGPEEGNGDGGAFGPPPFDPRWIRCRRPIIISGGELTLDMLDLKLDPISRDYEAPLQLKASGGVYVIDDFGRQLVRPADLLNRWIIPLERNLDYLTLHTGKKFEVPFDEFVIFSTNLAPEDFMDTAFLRRIHYKFRIDPPSVEGYERLFRAVCENRGVEVPQEILDYILNEFYPESGLPIAGYHPKFIIEHVAASCQYEGRPTELTRDVVRDALSNLTVGLTEAHES